MPKATPLQSSVNAGEFSPRMVARTDFSKYPHACARLENMIPVPQGGATRRAGTKFVAGVKDSARKVRLIPFEFSTEQAYLIEAGDSYLRFFKDRGRIEVADTDAAITNGTFDSDIAGWTDRSTGAAGIAWNGAEQQLDLNGAVGGVAWAEQAVATGQLGQEHVLAFRVVAAAGEFLHLRIGTTATGAEILADRKCETGWHTVAFTPPGATFHVQFRNADFAKTVRVDDVALIDGAPLEIGSPYLEADLSGLKWAQSADVLYVVQPDRPVHKLSRTGHESWSLTEVDLRDGPYGETNLDAAKTLQPSATSGLGITITAAGHGPFVAGDVGRSVRIKHGANWGWARITAFLSATQVEADVKSDFTGTTASSDWRLGAWCAQCGYPQAVTFFEQRLAFAATRDRPQTFWLSQSADFENMRPDDGAGTIEDDDALDFTISADQVNAVRWIWAGRQLVVGTVGGEWLVQSDGPLLTPTDIDVKRQTAFGSANLRPQNMRGRLLFIQRAARKLLEFTFSFDLDNYQALDMTLLCDHITRGGLTDMAYQQELNSTLWCVRGDGVLPTLTYQPDQNVIGWARQILGGRFGTGGAVAEGLAIIPGDGQDEVWLVCKRTIAGATMRYIEVLSAGFDTGDDPAAACYADSALAYDGVATTTIAGLDHLEGEEVCVLADGAVHPPRTVAAGTIALDYPASKVVAGLKYAHFYESLKWEAGAVAGTAQGQTKRIHGVTLVLMESMNASVGPTVDALETVPFRSTNDRMDSAIPYFTGERYVEFDGDYKTDTRVVICGDDPLPFTLLAIIPEIRVSAG